MLHAFNVRLNLNTYPLLFSFFPHLVGWVEKHILNFIYLASVTSDVACVFGGKGGSFYQHLLLSLLTPVELQAVTCLSVVLLVLGQPPR